MERAEREFPFDPKDRLEVPEPEMCEECCRPTLLLDGWDNYGGTVSAGECIACGHTRTELEAAERALDCQNSAIHSHQ
jgi:hypothetical protein